MRGGKHWTCCRERNAAYGDHMKVVSFGDVYRGFGVMMVGWRGENGSRKWSSKWEHKRGFLGW